MLRSLLPSRTSLADFSVKPAARKRSRSNEKLPACAGRKGPVTGKGARMDSICDWAHILCQTTDLGSPRSAIGIARTRASHGYQRFDRALVRLSKFIVNIIGH